MRPTVVGELVPHLLLGERELQPASVVTDGCRDRSLAVDKPLPKLEGEWPIVKAIDAPDAPLGFFDEVVVPQIEKGVCGQLSPVRHGRGDRTTGRSQKVSLKFVRRHVVAEPLPPLLGLLT